MRACISLVAWLGSWGSCEAVGHGGGGHTGWRPSAGLRPCSHTAAPAEKTTRRDSVHSNTCRHGPPFGAASYARRQPCDLPHVRHTVRNATRHVIHQHHDDQAHADAATIETPPDGARAHASKHAPKHASKHGCAWVCKYLSMCRTRTLVLPSMVTSGCESALAFTKP